MNRQWLIIPVAAIAMTALLLLGLHLRGYWSAPIEPATAPTEVAASEHGTTAGRGDMPTLQIPVDDAAMAFRRASDVRGALEVARRRFAADSPMLRSLSEEARVACSIVRRPDASARRVEGDPNRRVWLDQLLRRCAGLLDSDLAPPNPSANALAQWNRQLPQSAAFRFSLESGVDLAHEHLIRSADPSLLAESLRFLLDHERLPLSEIFAGVSVPSSGDIEASLIFAADWIGCVRGDSCSADSLWTLYTCAQFGCPDGSDLPAAYYGILPAQQYEIARRLAVWATKR
jgi:hypothetical protein